MEQRKGLAARNFRVGHHDAPVPRGPQEGSGRPRDLTAGGEPPRSRRPARRCAAFLIFRTGPTHTPLTVHYAIGGTALNGLDYAAIPNSVTIPAGRPGARVVIRPVDDHVAEPIETVILTLQPPADDPPAYEVGRPSVAGAIIVDNDCPRPPTRRLGDGRMHLHLALSNGVPYRLEASSNLLDWVPLITHVVTEDEVHFVEDTPDLFGSRFYRVVPELEVLPVPE